MVFVIMFFFLPDLLGEWSMIAVRVFFVCFNDFGISVDRGVVKNVVLKKIFFCSGNVLIIVYALGFCNVG